MNEKGCRIRVPRFTVLDHMKKAFTLIELLVVIAIIGMLVALLLPGLRSAKRAAESVVCRSHLKGAGIGMRTYTTNWDDWIPGPNTSGYNVGRFGYSNPGSSMTPVQNVDWISPTIGDQLGLDGEYYTKLRSLFDTDMNCPSNRLRYDYVYPSSIAGINPEEIRYSSYSTPIMFHMVMDYGQNKKLVYDSELRNYVKISRGYFPKMSKIGSPSRKVWAMDGARYYDPSKGLSFNDLPYQNDGGNFMLRAPVLPMKGDPYKFDIPDKNDYTTWDFRKEDSYNMYGTEKLAYRHNKKINAVFFDGHCESMGLLDSLSASYYFPSGTEVTELGAMLMLSNMPISGGFTIK